MKITCPHCQNEIEVNPAALLGSITSRRKADAVRRNGASRRQAAQKETRQKRPPSDANRAAHSVILASENC